MGDKPKIGYIGNFEPAHSTENEIAAGFEAIGYDVTRVQEQDCDWGWLPVHAHQADVEFVLWTHTHDRAPESRHEDCFRYLLRCRDLGVQTVGVHLDRWWGLERQAQAELEPFFRQDLVCTADGGHDVEWGDLGVNHVWLPPAVRHDAVVAAERTGWRHDVAFVGGWNGYSHDWPWRKRMIHWLQQNYEGRLGLYPQPGEPAVRGVALNELYANVRCLIGDSCLAGGAVRYWSDRIPETIGRGGLLVHPDVIGLDEHYPADMLPVRFELGSFDDLRDKIEMVLSIEDHDRDHIVATNQAFALEHHTYAVRAAQIAEHAKVDRLVKGGY